MPDFPSYAPSGLMHDYNPTNNFYNLRGANMRRTSAKLGAVQGALGSLDAVVIGDSGMIGYNGQGSGTGSTGYVSNFNIGHQLAQELAANTDCVYPGIQGIQLAMAAALASVGDRWVTTGAFSASVSAQLATFSGAGTDTWSSLDKGTAVDLVYSDQSAAFTYSIDGGTAVAVTPGGTATLKKISVTGLASATHTVKATFTTAYGILAAARVYTPGIGQLTVHNLALGGAYAIHAGTPGKNWSDTTSTGLGNTSKLIMSTIGVDPDLVVCSCGGNDLSSETPSNIITGLTNMRNLWPNADFLLINAPMVNGGNVADYESLAGMKFQLADSLNFALYDWNDALGGRNTAVANGVLGPDLNHETSGESLRVGRHIGRVIAQVA